MFVIDFHASRRQAFQHGFMKGLAAPVMVFGVFTAPSVTVPPMVQTSQVSAEEALANDWAKIGNDIKRSVSAYGEESGQDRE